MEALECVIPPKKHLLTSLKLSVSVDNTWLLDLHNSLDDSQTSNIYHRHTHVHLVQITVWSVQVTYINLSVEGTCHYRQQTLIVIVRLRVKYVLAQDS